MSHTAVSFDPALPIAIVGAGVMGTKVAWACARVGIPTRLFDVEPGKAEASFARAVSWSTGRDAELVTRNLSCAPTLANAVQGVQLAFENVPERLELKCSVAKTLASLAPEHACLGSNASVLLCSPMARASGRPERFFNMNFTDPRHARLVEVMTAPEASPDTIAFARAWARHIGMVPVVLQKENLGYSKNRLWRVIKKEVLRQVAEGIASPENIDRAWMLSYGTEMGPFGLMDEIGLHSIYRVEQQYYELTGDESDRPPAFLKEMVEAGRLGVGTGRGFYTYPDPHYRRPGWITGEE